MSLNFKTYDQLLIKCKAYGYGIGRCIISLLSFLQQRVSIERSAESQFAPRSNDSPINRIGKINTIEITKHMTNLGMDKNDGDHEDAT